MCYDYDKGVLASERVGGRAQDAEVLSYAYMRGNFRNGVVKEGTRDSGDSLRGNLNIARSLFTALLSFFTLEFEDNVEDYGFA